MTTTITIPLSDERLAQLRSLAERTGVSPEEFVLRYGERLLESPDDAFRQAAEHVLRKNHGSVLHHNAQELSDVLKIPGAAA